ncbi:hypothetical protein BDF20DRAFT_823484 [Mycotypha africana]|uniref:uncharacterized protein n=1 Tax=Mycotypha africana TaxID=64632 RepID=UPI0023018AF4|nr:uncharacterized protein BDF20DRAFT_823484 [Mycotypha africana]KAI8973789.1 hypothetical protein BDF20DRAFT_823484 [Mycotypha africana]
MNSNIFFPVDLLSFLNEKNKVCLVTLDFAGLSTDCVDLEKKYTQIKKIMVDLLPYTNTIHE